ncbi:hypothetical protein [Mucilaginibacter defluvii]|uniref:HNH endonuclease n=1 Tax=Mucilaginibacter defluvii TaxID=1196019 RepID=A0ABP9FX72_9SPHI
MIGICKLCLKEKELIKRSHIFPNFMYRGIPNEKGQIHVVNSDYPYQRKTVQSGAHERYILCATCDNEVLGSLERYASNALYRQPYLKESKDFKHLHLKADIGAVECLNVNYHKFKLFLLSLLWRASIADDGLFVNFKLPPDAAEFVRRAIYEDDVVDETVFPCILLTCDTAKVQTDYVGVDASKQGIVKFYINEFAYTFYLDPKRIDDEVMFFTIKMDQPMRIMKVSKRTWYQIRFSIAAALANAARKNR